MAGRDTASHLSPTALEIAYRHKTAQAAHLKLARQYGNTPKGRRYLALAEANAKVEQRMKDLHHDQLLARDGLLDDYRRLNHR